MKNRNISKCSSFHRTKSAFLSLCVCVCWFVSPLHTHSRSLFFHSFIGHSTLYFRFTMLQIIFHLEHASCLLSAFAFVRNICHSMTFCLIFDSHSCLPARSSLILLPAIYMAHSMYKCMPLVNQVLFTARNTLLFNRNKFQCPCIVCLLVCVRILCEL